MEYESAGEGIELNSRNVVRVVADMKEKIGDDEADVSEFVRQAMDPSKILPFSRWLVPEEERHTAEADRLPKAFSGMMEDPAIL